MHRSYFVKKESKKEKKHFKYSLFCREAFKLPENRKPRNNSNTKNVLAFFCSFRNQGITIKEAGKRVVMDLILFPRTFAYRRFSTTNAYSLLRKPQSPHYERNKKYFSPGCIKSVALLLR